MTNNPPLPRVDHPILETLAADYAQAVNNRRDLQRALRARLLEAVAGLLPVVRDAAACERDCHHALLAAVTAAPHLFVQPRSRVVHGVKYGWQTNRATISIPDEAKTIKLIRDKLPEDQATLLIRVKEAVDKRTVLDLDPRDLRRLAIVQVPASDAPLVSIPQDTVDKLVDVLLADTAEAAHG